MKRDAWYAAIAAAGLFAVAAGYALIKAPDLADPSVTLTRSKLTASLPSPPKLRDDADILSKAQSILIARDPFVEQSGDAASVARGLELPKLGPPVRFSDPGVAATVATPSAAAAPEALSTIPLAPAPQGTTAQQSRGSLTLRGVFPSPSGGRALVALPDGRVMSVGVGGDIGGWRVLQVQQGAIRLGRGQRTLLLAMPR